ncbi:hypothetical protein NEMBOFW57_005254 [Staphylotrichum longicolle]|uniref:Uncharacterized protein n=1 Tax=Staphylotrichum longicolle TaxID=669026 RepID=A0AAD4EX34_9PEZI|nr:hypothetical protein NEMBOFW57_005254 [Staphylotrichum longicolle]
MSQRTARFPTRPVAQLLGSSGPVHAVTYSASPGTYILTGSSDRSIRLYNPSSHHRSPIPTGKLIKPTPPRLRGALPRHLRLQRDLLLGRRRPRRPPLGRGHGPDAAALRLRLDRPLPRGRVNAVCFAGADDALVVSGGLDCSVRVWDVRSNAARPVQVLGEARDAVTCLAVADGEIVAGSVDGRVRAYDVRMGRCVVDTFPGSVTSVALARDGRTMLVGSLDSKVRLMDRRDGVCLRAFGEAGWRNEELRVQSVFGGGERFFPPSMVT